MTPLNYYLWGAVKDNCCANKPETIDALKDNIHEGISEIQLPTIDNVLKNSADRVGGYCIASRGSHLNEIINYILFIYELSIFDHLLGVVSQTRDSGGNRTHDPYTNSLAHYPLDYQSTLNEIIFHY